ncbi:hypothetical protein, unknown function [Leishmania tarentolae]|uniref:Leucine-rich repeat protein n=1 Tax=Leishmania tarentolae TaxID=5689 RepID=A0A640KP56_LEITA|nr:hypothetical protein, unknown function [Leishmania tarentolae]
MCVSRLHDRMTQTPVVTADAAVIVVGRAAGSATPSGARVAPVDGLCTSSPAGATSMFLSLSLTMVLPHLRFLNLSNTMTLSSDEGIEGLVALEKMVLARCSQFHSLPPLGTAPSFEDIVASLSGIFDLTGLGKSHTLLSLSLYRCLTLTDVRPCGRIPTLRDMFIVESTVGVLEELRDSRTRARLRV